MAEDDAANTRAVPNALKEVRLSASGTVEGDVASLRRVAPSRRKARHRTASPMGEESVVGRRSAPSLPLGGRTYVSRTPVVSAARWTAVTSPRKGKPLSALATVVDEDVLNLNAVAWLLAPLTYVKVTRWRKR